MAVVKGDKLAGSDKLARCEYTAALAYAWFISNQGVTDDFGRGRLAPHSLWTKVFEKRIEAGVLDITPEMIRGWFDEYHRVGLIRVYRTGGTAGSGGERWFEWVNFQGVPPSHRRFHRAPEPPWSAHEHAHRCSRSSNKFSNVVSNEEVATQAVSKPLASRCPSTSSSVLLSSSPSSVPLSSSVPLRPNGTDTDYGLTEHAANGAACPGQADLDLADLDDALTALAKAKRKKPHTNGNGHHQTWPTAQAIDDWHERYGAGSGHPKAIVSHIHKLVTAQAKAKGITPAEAWSDVVRPAWRRYLGLDGKAGTTHPSPGPAEFSAHFGDWLPGGQGPALSARERAERDERIRRIYR